MTMQLKAGQIRTINEEYNKALDIARPLPNREELFKQAEIKKTTALAELFKGVKKPVIELKSIKHIARMSEETPCYDATLYVNGSKFCEVSNRGHGGCDDTRGASCDAVIELDALIAVTYPRDEKYNFAETLESLCHGFVWAHVDAKEFKSKYGRKVMTLQDGKIYEYKGALSQSLIDAVLRQTPTATVLNTMEFAKAYEIYKKFASQ